MRTEFATEAEFISAFHELCDETTIFAPTEKMKPAGADCAFSLELADGSPMVRGLGVIRNAWPTVDSPFGRPGIHIVIGQLTDGSKPVIQKLHAARIAASAKPRTRPAPSTHQLWGHASGPPTEEMDAPEVEEPEVAELPHRITREIRGVADLTDEAQPDDDGETKQAGRYVDPKSAIPERLPERPPTLPGAVAPAPIAHPRLASAPVVSVAPMAEMSDDIDQALAASRAKPWWLNARVGAVFAGGIVLGLVMSLMFRSSEAPKPVAAAAAPPPSERVAAATPPPNCPPPPEPAPLAVVEQPETTSKVRVAKATPKATAKPAAAKASFTTKAATAVAATKPTTKPAATTAPGAAAKIAAATKPVTTAGAATKPTTTKPTAVATLKAATGTKPAPTAKVATTKAKTKKPKGGCSSLDCI